MTATPATIIIIIFSILLSIRSFQNTAVRQKLLHIPFLEQRNSEWYRFISAGFIHGGILHLFINMFVLYEFGRYVEIYLGQTYGKSLGSLAFSLIYLANLILAHIPSFVKHKNNPNYSALGASGAVSGILFIYVLLAPWQPIYLYGIIPIYSIVAAIAYLIYSSWASKNTQSNIGHDAHLYGALGGLLLGLIASPSLLSEFIKKLINTAPW